MIMDCDVCVLNNTRFTCSDRLRYSRAKIGIASDSNQTPVLMINTNLTKHKFKIFDNCTIKSSTIRFFTPLKLVYIRECDQLMLRALMTMICKILSGEPIPKLCSVANFEKLKPRQTSLAINGKNYDPNDLKNNCLTKLFCEQLKLIPRLIWKLNQLKELRLTSCELIDIPIKLMDLRNSLKILDLSRNSIDNIDGSFVVAMRQLRHFDISNNKISYLPLEMKIMRCLEHLNVSHNQLTHLPFTIGTIARLKNLDISHNNLSCIPFSLIKHMSATVRLHKLDVSHNSFNGAFDGSASHQLMPSLSLPTLKCLSASAVLSDDRTLYNAHNFLPKMLYHFIQLNGEMCSQCFSPIVNKQIKREVIRQCLEQITETLSTSHFPSFPLFPSTKYLCDYCHNRSMFNQYYAGII